MHSSLVADYSSRRPQQVSFLSAKSRKLRLQFKTGGEKIEKHYLHWLVSNSHRFMFSLYSVTPLLFAEWQLTAYCTASYISLALMIYLTESLFHTSLSYHQPQPPLCDIMSSVYTRTPIWCVLSSFCGRYLCINNQLPFQVIFSSLHLDKESETTEHAH